MLACSLAAGCAAWAQDAPPADPPSFRVMTKATPPFVIEGAGGELSGLSVDLWSRVAADLGVQTEWELAPLEDMLAAVEAGEADAAISAITISAEREASMDFSHAYFSSGLGIAVPAESSGMAGLWGIVGAFFSVAFLQAVAALALVLFVSGVLMWLFERRRNAEQFGGGAAGVANGFWWSAVTMTTVGYGDKAPVTLGGRLVALVWMFASIIVIAAFTGGIASAITVGALEGKVQGPEDLPGARVAAPAGTTATGYLARNGVPTTTTDNIEDAMALLADGQVDAVVHDAPVLRHLARTDRDGVVRVLEATFQPQNYGIALPTGSPLRERINRAILAETSSLEWQETVRRYLGR